jgi:hypothetical protein
MPARGKWNIKVRAKKVDAKKSPPSKHLAPPIDGIRDRGIGGATPKERGKR